MMKITSTIILVLLCAWAAQAQQTFPPQPYRPDEMVSLNRNVPFNTALEILNGFSQRFENRLLIDSKVRTNPIGVAVENMQWKRALEYILRANLLKFEMRDRYYEVKEMVAGKEEEEVKDPVDIWSREIEINAVFFQADYEALHEMGIDWSTFKNGTVRVQTLGASNVGKEFLRASYNGTLQNSAISVSALLRLFESKSKGEILARPQIRVLDGEQGKIKVGKNFYLILQDFAGNSRYTEYEAGVILTVKPTLYGRSDSTFIHLEILAERSDVQPDAFGPTKNITEGATRVLLLNGEETVLAGLVSHEKQELRRGLPILKDLPLFRHLFGYNSTAVRKKELVILIEAKVVPSLLARKNAPATGLNRQLEKQRQEFKKLQQEIENNGNKRSSARGTGRTSQARP
ncbi:MAG: type II secretion system protein GspD [bacterium]